MDTQQPNLAGLAAEAAAENDAVTVPLRDRSGEPYVRHDGSPVTIAVLGEFSTAVRAAQDANMRRLMRQRGAQLEPDLVTENRVHVALAALVGWNLEDADGAAVLFTPANVKAVFALAPWILDQVDEAARRHASFFGTSSAS
jgi:hypothetical protein